jgi:hypothetical protein
VRASLVCCAGLCARVAQASLFCCAGLCARVAQASLLITTLSCATTSAPKKEQDVIVTLANKSAATHCGAQIEVLLGGVPDGATKLTDGVLTSKNPRPQLRYEQIARAIAKQQCVDGVSILSAEEVSGGLIHADIALWFWPEQ